MTNQEINERVAKLCGWTRQSITYVSYDGNDERFEYKRMKWLSKDNWVQDSIPNYTESLDACREFESFKTGEEWSEYIDTLTEICDVYNDPIVATPLQRCEAFLRLKGQWDEN